jgi:Winged helix DNA-binding domain
MVELTTSEALALRMASLQLAASDGVPVAGDVEGLARWFGAMQGQDLGSLQWSLGLRLGCTLAEVEAELERGGALRTWPMRGTIHLVPAEDARWMLRVLGEKPLAGAAKRREYLGLSVRDADRAVELLGAALAGGGRLTRAQCLEVLEAGGVSGAGQRGYHLLWYASQHGVTCIAPNVDGEQTFVLLDEWAPTPRELSREAALAELALRYFRSHGPTTRQDFAGWAGLTAADAKAGIAGAGEALTVVQVEGTPMVLASALLDAATGQSSTSAVHDRPKTPEWLALPGFDEYLLGFKDRSLMVDAAGMDAVIPGKNGVFRATLVRDGGVVGTWKRTLTASTVTVEVTPLVRLGKAARAEAELAWEGFGRFHDRSVRVRWTG